MNNKTGNQPSAGQSAEEISPIVMPDAMPGATTTAAPDSAQTASSHAAPGAALDTSSYAARGTIPDSAPDAPDAPEHLPLPSVGTLFSSMLSLSGTAREASVAAEVSGCNSFTVEYGLTLSPAQSLALARTVTESLREAGRVEPGGSILPALIRTFAPSPYINHINWESELHRLCDIFYRFKSEMRERMSDAELLEFMRELYDGVCAGSTELLESRDLDAATRRIRAGLPPDEPPEERDDTLSDSGEYDDGEGDDDFTIRRIFS